MEKIVEHTIDSVLVAVERGVIGVAGIFPEKEHYLREILEKEQREYLKDASKYASLELKKVSENDLKSKFRRIVKIIIDHEKTGEIDIVALRKIFTDKEIRMSFPMFADLLPHPNEEIYENTQIKYNEFLRSGLTSRNILSAMTNFNQAKSFERKALTIVDQPQKLSVNAYISLTEGLVSFCQGILSKEGVYFEEALKKFDEAVDVIPSAHFPLRLFSEALTNEDENERRNKISNAKKVASSSKSQNKNPMEKYLIDFMLKFAEG